MLHSKTEKTITLLGNKNKAYTPAPKLLPFSTFEKENNSCSDQRFPNRIMSVQSTKQKIDSKLLTESELLGYMSRNLSLYNNEKVGRS